jgi:hypothetical protein
MNTGEWIDNVIVWTLNPYSRVQHPDSSLTLEDGPDVGL